MDVKGLAQKYYPRLWDIDRLKALVAAGKLSEADYKDMYPGRMDIKADDPIERRGKGRAVGSLRRIGKVR